MRLLKANQCCVCGRELTNEKSLAQGAGDVCASARAGMLAGIGTSDEEIAVIAADAELAKFAGYILTDLHYNRQRSAKHWLGSARRKMGTLVLEQAA